MLKLKIDRATAAVETRFWGEGSVLAETVQTHCPGVSTRLSIESSEPAEKIAKLARLALQGCYVIQTLQRPTPVDYLVELNGSSLEFEKEDR